jgi:hypothetical protein
MMGEPAPRTVFPHGAAATMPNRPASYLGATLQVSSAMVSARREAPHSCTLFRRRVSPLRSERATHPQSCRTEATAQTSSALVLGSSGRDSVVACARRESRHAAAHERCGRCLSSCPALAVVGRTRVDLECCGGWIAGALPARRPPLTGGDRGQAVATSERGLVRRPDRTCSQRGRTLTRPDSPIGQFAHAASRLQCHACAYR